MPAPNWTANNVTEIAVLGRWTNGRPVVNVHYIQREEDDPEQSARDLLNNWQDHIIAMLPNNYSLEGARYRDRNSDPGVVGVILPDPAKPIVGPGSSEVAPPNVSYLVKKLGPLLVGQRTGRMYLPGIPESAVDENGVIAPATVTALQDLLDDFLSGLDGAGVNNLVLVHFTGPTDTTGTVSQINSLALQNVAATMRRRLRK